MWLYGCIWLCLFFCICLLLVECWLLFIIMVWLLCFFLVDIFCCYSFLWINFFLVFFFGLERKFLGLLKCRFKEFILSLFWKNFCVIFLIFLGFVRLIIFVILICLVLFIFGDVIFCCLILNDCWFEGIYELLWLCLI